MAAYLTHWHYTTIPTFQSVDLNSRNSSWVLPPSGGSNFSLNFDEATEQPVKKRMSSNILGTLQEKSPTWAKSTGDKRSGGTKDSESRGTPLKQTLEKS